ncbi:MFS transporter [Saliphagus sp. GCM10025334]
MRVRQLRPSVPREVELTVALVSGSHAINHLYLVLLPPIFGILAGEFDVGLATLGLAVGTQGAFNMVFQLPFGYVSDNHSRLLALCSGLGLASVGVLVTASAPTIEWVFVGQAILGIGIAAHHPAHFPMLSAATSSENRGRVFSIHSFSGNIGYAAAPTLIVALTRLDGVTWRAVFVFAAVLGAGYGLLCLLVFGRYVGSTITRREGTDSGDSADAPLATETRHASARERVRKSLESLATSPAIVALAVLALVTGIANWGIRSYAVVLLTDGYGLDLGLANVLYTAMFVVTAIIILVGGDLADRISAESILLTSYGGLLVAALVVGSFLLPPLLAGVAVILAGGSIGFGGPARSKLTDKLSAQADLGTNFAVITVGITLAGSVAPPVFGVIIDYTSFSTAFLVIGGVGAVCIALTLAILQRYGTGFERESPVEAD